MHTYTKLFHEILDSTVWQSPAATKIVWITMLAMTDRDGVVLASVPGLAHRAGVSREECQAALETFSKPDPDSRSQEFEGRRIERVDGGWRLLNHSKYREMMSLEERREYQRQAQARYRQKKKAVEASGGDRVSERLRAKAEEEGDQATIDALDRMEGGGRTRGPSAPSEVELIAAAAASIGAEVPEQVYKSIRNGRARAQYRKERAEGAAAKGESGNQTRNNPEPLAAPPTDDPPVEDGERFPEEA